MRQIPQFQKGQRVSIYNSQGASSIYEVDEVRWAGSTWEYTFLDCWTKEPVFISFSNGGYTRYRQDERWLTLV